jgi:arginine decarboxylase
VLGRIAADPPPDRLDPLPGEPRVVQELKAMARDISAKTYLEYYHDAVELRDEMITLFNIGMISLADRALAEGLYWDIARKAMAFGRREKIPLEELEDLERALHEKYIVNFSVFQSTPDHWALDQLFPVVPLTRLREEPTHPATLVDITCDSDGAIDRFVDLKDVKETLPLHDIPTTADAPYDLAVLLLGAYQDVMGDMHNLFGAPDEVLVVVDDAGEPRVQKVVRGDTVGEVLRVFGYPHEELLGRLQARLAERVADGGLGSPEAERMIESYRALFSRGTYLSRLG